MSDLTRSLRLLAYFIVGVLLSAVSMFSYAETYVAPTGFKATTNQNIRGSIAAACTDFNVNSNGASRQSETWLPTTFDCQYVNAGTTYWGLQKVNSVLYCPGGGTISGSNCINATPCVLPETRVAATGLCAVPPPTCVGAQFLDTVANVCKCVVQQPTTKSYQSGGTCGNPPSCSNGCEQSAGGAWGLPVIVGTINFSSIASGNLTSTCYAEVGQTGATCSTGGAGGPVQITLAPAGATGGVPPAAPGVNSSGGADPLATTANNSNPILCGNAGGSYGVFNGSGICMMPSPVLPTISTKNSASTSTNAAGQTTTNTTTTTQVCTGAGSCTSSTTTSSGGGGGGSVTTTGQGSSGSSNLTKTGDGTYKLDLPTDYQRDATGLLLNQKVDAFTEMIGKPTADDSAVTTAKHTTDSEKAMTDADKAVTDAVNGAEPGAVSSSVSVWTQTMSSGWWSPIPAGNCAPFNSRIGSWSWELDICPTAAKISEIGAYCMWILLVFSGFRMLTTPRSNA